MLVHVIHHIVARVRAHLEVHQLEGHKQVDDQLRDQVNRILENPLPERNQQRNQRQKRDVKRNRDQQCVVQDLQEWRQMLGHQAQVRVVARENLRGDRERNALILHEIRYRFADVHLRHRDGLMMETMAVGKRRALETDYGLGLLLL